MIVFQTTFKDKVHKKRQLQHYVFFQLLLDMDTEEAIRKGKIARFRFDEITEAYQTLMDPNQRSFYDQHGFAADALR